MISFLTLKFFSEKDAKAVMGEIHHRRPSQTGLAVDSGNFYACEVIEIGQMITKLERIQTVLNSDTADFRKLSYIQSIIDITDKDPGTFAESGGL